MTEATVQFFRVENTRPTGSIDAAFREAIRRKGLRQNRTTEYAITNGGVHLDTANVVVEMATFRRDDLPAIYSRGQGVWRDMVLEMDEYVGERTAFVYVPTTRVLALMMNQFSVTPHQIEKYVSERSGVGIALNPMLTLDAIDRIARARTVYALQLKLFGRLNSLPRDLDTTIAGGLAAASEVEAQKLTITIGEAHFHGNRLGSIIESVRRLADFQRRGAIKNVQASLTGRDEHDDIVRVDLIDELLKVRVPLGAARRANALDFPTRVDVIRRGMDMVGAEIETLLETARGQV